jgi:hypothetical protein
MFKFLIFCLVWIFCLNTNISAGTIDPNNPDSEYLEFAHQKLFDCVSPLISKKEDKTTSTSSCVVIKPKAALTAAHIFATVPKDHTFYILVNNKAYLVEEVICHKLFKPSKMGFYDIALCKTSEPIDLMSFPELYRGRKELFKKVKISGYGLAGTFDTGSKIADGKKRAGTNLVEAIKNHSLICSPSHSPGSNLEFLISHGDSGGGLFIDNKLAGINSYVYTNDGNANSSREDKAGHTRVSLFLDWIKENTE